MKLTQFISASMLLISFQFKSAAQCSNPINNFPYTENFENSDGSWTPGGAGSDWAWGSPTKAVINSAASGSKCWIAGSLNQSNYASNENSTLSSPCFDLSSLISPYIKFNIFWETERKYDGATFQYSIDGGNNWTTLGSSGATCSSNWFNTSAVTALSEDGWSGNIQASSACSGGAGNGSGGWKSAQYDMSNLAGQANVRFRFRFAAGNICNNYDGFAIDDIWIGEKYFSSAEFTFSCVNSTTTYLLPKAPPCSAGFSWDFGDPASGSSNTSNQYDPSHNFSAPGQYMVTLSIQNGNNPPPMTSQQITVIDVSAVVITPISCFGDKATIEAQPTPAGNYNYKWNTIPPQTTPTITGLSGGNYTVTVSGNGVCPNSQSIAIVEPAKLQVSLGGDTTICPGQQLKLDAGNFNSYLWQNGATGRTFDVSQSGIYSVTVGDNNGCTASDDIEVIFDCSDIYFPAGFTPNHDGTNDDFGALGNLAAISNYSLKIYNRWGELVFHANDPFQKWNGQFSGSLQPTGSFVWIAEYNLKARNSKQFRRGVITLIR